MHAALQPQLATTTAASQRVRPAAMIRRTLVPIALCLLAAACASSTQVAQRDNDRCTARGLKPETKEFERCMLDVETERKVRMDERHRALIERSGAPPSALAGQ